MGHRNERPRYMTYSISGLPLAGFAPLFAMDDAALRAHGARRVVASADRGYPCRVSLEDARRGETLILLNHISNASEGPYRAAHAIFIRERAREAPRHIDRTPPVFAGRTLSLRAFDEAGDLVTARLAPPDEHDSAICALLSDARVDHIDAHNAAHGCFAARIERYKEAE
jgi:hypothetical protein